ncbi:HNH endonuclease [Pseudobdellovibrio exovorus]|uniref:HNH nuclease domain-containing protein n=1 Tax=Pseudobdellovibrio exovorus JSS TaxID=1184267 RepID=M4VTV2_9BACT|nr:HNH endonuclease [Pseudobdellovibrio exovorus]AGH96634.1 hypothetical protein A11Q_2418 [Pseudobdellovibrio exovorus JSS]
MGKNRIENLYTLSNSEKELLKLPESKKKDSWDTHTFQDLKKNLKSHLYVEQENLCVYCKQELSKETRLTHIEHVIARDNNEKFCFALKNLALSCRDCNSAKSAKYVYHNERTEKSLSRYPHRSVRFLIPHPHYDNFDEHVSFFLDFYPIEVNQSSKGIKLIEICNLRRFGLMANKITAEFKNSAGGMEEKIYKLSAKSPEEALAGIDEIIAELL